MRCPQCDSAVITEQHDECGKVNFCPVCGAYYAFGDRGKRIDLEYTDKDGIHAYGESGHTVNIKDEAEAVRQLTERGFKMRHREIDEAGRRYEVWEKKPFKRSV